MKELSYDKMIEENKREISHFENQVEYCMDQMRKSAYFTNKDALDEHFKRAMHFMISLWTAETALIDSQIRHKKKLEAKAKSGAVYGKAALEAGKEEAYEDSLKNT